MPQITTTVTTAIKVEFTQEELLKILCKAVDVPFTEKLTLTVSDKQTGETWNITDGVVLKSLAEETTTK
jgi:hypothetical protein